MESTYAVPWSASNHAAVIYVVIIAFFFPIFVSYFSNLLLSHEPMSSI